MLAFKIIVNGELRFIAGVEDWDSIHTVIMALRESSDDDTDIIDLKVGGLAEEQEPGKIESVRWPNTNLSIGDEVTISIVETNTVDKPLKRYRSDSTIQESPFTEEEMYELQKQDYLRLKEKFKNEDFT